MSFQASVVLLAFAASVCDSAPASEPLAPDVDSARALTEAQRTEYALPDALVRALPQGPQTPVFALLDIYGDTVGIQFELPVNEAPLQARGLRRLSRRLSSEHPGAVWLAPASAPHLGRVAVLTLNPTVWRVKTVVEIPLGVDEELLDELWADETAVLHAVDPEWLEFEFTEPAGAPRAVSPPDEQPLKNQERVRNSVRRGWIRLPVK